MSIFAREWCLNESQDGVGMKSTDNFGKTIKAIREARRLTQKEISPPNTARSNVSKIENGQQALHFSTLLHFLDSFQVNIDEFLYISSHDQLNESEKIIEDFFKLFKLKDYDNIEALYRTVKSFNESNEYDWYIEMMEDFLKINIDHLHHKTKKDDFEDRLSRLTKIVITKINNFDDWFINDLRMLNFIAYYLSYEDLKVITPQMFKKFKFYKDYPRIIDLQAAYILNLSAAYMKNGKHSLASQILEDKSDEILKSSNIYFQYIYRIRKLILQKDHDSISKFLNSLNFMLEDKTLINQLNLEVFRNIPSYFLKNPENFKNFENDYIEKLGFEDIVWLLV